MRVRFTRDWRDFHKDDEATVTDRLAFALFSTGAALPVRRKRTKAVTDAPERAVKR